MIWNPIRLTTEQGKIITQALQHCSFPFDRLLPSLRRENRSDINIHFRDLSRYSENIDEGTHTHVHDGHAVAHPIVRPIGGRSRVLGLFYLPPHTAIVLDEGLTEYPELAIEVFLAEAAHAVDYHYMTNEMRREFWNAVHPDNDDDLGVTTHVDESGDLDHGHSWFDGEAGYDTWVGEAWMQGFVNTFAPDVKYTMPLAHPTPPEAIPHLRRVLLGEPAPQPEPEPPVHQLTLWQRIIRRVLTWWRSL